MSCQQALRHCSQSVSSSLVFPAGCSKRRRSEKASWEDGGGSRRSTCFCVEDSPPEKKESLSLRRGGKPTSRGHFLLVLSLPNVPPINDYWAKKQREREREKDGEPSCPESGALKKQERGREGGEAPNVIDFNFVSPFFLICSSPRLWLFLELPFFSCVSCFFFLFRSRSNFFDRLPTSIHRTVAPSAAFLLP